MPFLVSGYQQRPLESPGRALELGLSGMPAGPVSVTISVATWDENCRTLDKLLTLADLALYIAKEGRNRVHAWNS